MASMVTKSVCPLDNVRHSGCCFNADKLFKVCPNKRSVIRSYNTTDIAVVRARRLSWQYRDSIAQNEWDRGKIAFPHCIK